MLVSNHKYPISNQIITVLSVYPQLAGSVHIEVLALEPYIPKAEMAGTGIQVFGMEQNL